MQLDHVGIVVANISETLERWRPLLGEPESVPEPSREAR